jgi:endonuclease YncB( thermonuclease family)
MASPESLAARLPATTTRSRPRKLKILAILLLLAWPAAAQTGVDGDTLKLNGIPIRLAGIGAPKLQQVCPDGWPAGRLAATALQALMAGRIIS